MRYDNDIDYGGTAGVVVNLTTGTATDGFGNTDTLSGIEDVRGTNQADSFIGDAGNNRFRGLGGNDTLNGGTGSDTAAYDDDALNGGFAGVTVNLATGTAVDGFGNTDALISIENARGTNSADTLTGDGNDNSFVSLGGNDNVSGAGGLDEIRYDVDAYRGGTAGVVVNLATGVATDGFGNTDTLSSIEIVRGTQSADNFLGSSADETFRGLGGNDTINGGSGIDWVSYSRDIFARQESQTLSAVSVNLSTGTATDSFGGTDTLSNIENVAGGLLADTLIGNTVDNIFRGLAGNDTINGGTGNDTADYSEDRAVGALAFLDGSGP